MCSSEIQRFPNDNPTKQKFTAEQLFSLVFQSLIQKKAQVYIYNYVYSQKITVGENLFFSNCSVYL